MTTDAGDDNGHRAATRALSDQLPAWLPGRLHALADLQGATVMEVIEQAVSMYGDHWRQSIQPDDARLAPAHWWCRLRRHRTVSWDYEIEPLSPGTRTRLVVAVCAHCQRPQQQLRVVCPPSRTIKVSGPADPGDTPDRKAAPVTGHVQPVTIR